MRTTRRRQPKALAMAVVMIVSGLGGLFLTQGTAVADVDSVRGTGYGISVRLAGSFVIPPSPNPTINPPLLEANESSTDFGPHTASLITIGGVLGVLNNGIAVGPVVSQAAGIVGENHLGAIAVASQVANISALSDALNIPLINTTCTANGDGFTTTVNVSNARLGLPPPLGSGATLLNGPVDPTIIDVLGVATVRLHERQVVENIAPSGGNPGRTRVVVNGARISVPVDGSILEIILAQAECEAVGPDVLLPPTTAAPVTTTTTVAATTSSTAGATTSSTVAATTSSTVAATTSSTVAATTSSTAAPTTSTTTPPTGTIASTTTTTVAGVVTTVSSGVLVRTGSSLKPLAMLSMVSIVLGILLLIGSGRPLTANAYAGGDGSSGGPGGGPERWGPVEVGKTIWAGFAMLIMGPGELISRRRRRADED